jgi:hypothetical protein
MVEPDATERNPVQANDYEAFNEPARSKWGVYGLAVAAVAAGAWLVLRAAVPAGEPAALPPIVAAAAPAQTAPAEVAGEEGPIAVVNDVTAETPHAEFASAELPSKTNKPAEPAHVEAAPPAPVAAAPAPAPEAAGPTWTPHVVTVGDKAQVSVPISGSTKTLSRFLLDSPPGLAVDLPDATTLVSLRSYLLHDPAFYSLWVRKHPNGKGLQVRLHVTKGVHVGAEVVDGNLRFKRKD